MRLQFYFAFYYAKKVLSQCFVFSFIPHFSFLFLSLSRFPTSFIFIYIRINWFFLKKMISTVVLRSPRWFLTLSLIIKWSCELHTYLKKAMRRLTIMMYCTKRYTDWRNGVSHDPVTQRCLVSELFAHTAQNKKNNKKNINKIWQMQRWSKACFKPKNLWNISFINIPC